jgi:hypothetical protein
MPAVDQYPMQPNTPLYLETEKAFTTEIQDRAKVITRNWRYYMGDMPEPLKVGDDGVNPNVLLPKVGQLSDKLVSFLIGDGVTFDSGGDGESDAHDEAIEQLWQDNNQDKLLHNIALSGIIAGHVFVRIEPREGDIPRIVNLNPANCAAFWDITDHEHVLWYRMQYQVNEQGPGKRIDYVQGAYRSGEFDHSVRDIWYEVTYTTIGGFAPQWVRQDEPKPLDYDWSPIVDWQNLPRPFDYYGIDDITPAVKLNAALNFVASNFNLILKHHASPKTVGIGFDAADVVMSDVGGLYTVNKPAGEANLFNLEMQSDLASSSAFIERLSEEIWNSARMVDPRTLKDRVGALTNFGLRVMFTDAIKKTKTKRLLYSEGLEEISRRGLALMGMTPPDVIEVVWDDVLPVNESEQMEAITQKLASKIIDLKTAQEELGYDPEEIAERKAELGEQDDNIGAMLMRNFERGGVPQ